MSRSQKKSSKEKMAFGSIYDLLNHGYNAAAKENSSKVVLTGGSGLSFFRALPHIKLLFAQENVLEYVLGERELQKPHHPEKPVLPDLSNMSIGQKRLQIEINLAKLKDYERELKVYELERTEYESARKGILKVFNEALSIRIRENINDLLLKDDFCGAWSRLQSLFRKKLILFR